MLRFNVHEDEGTRLQRESWDSKHWLENPVGNIIVDQRQLLKIWENYIAEVYCRLSLPENLEVLVIISVYNIRNTLPKYFTFLLGHPVFQKVVNSVNFDGLWRHKMYQKIQDI
jgi:hypothetical protein